MNQGIIKTLKSNFRKNLALKIIECLNTGASAKYPKIAVLDVILMTHNTRTKLTQRTIFDYHKHAEFVLASVVYTMTSNAGNFDEEDSTGAIDNQL